MTPLSRCSVFVIIMKYHPSLVSRATAELRFVFALTTRTELSMSLLWRHSNTKSTESFLSSTHLLTRNLVFLVEMDPFFQELNNFGEPCLILVDMNFDFLKRFSIKNNYMTALSRNGSTQLILSPTRDGKLIDRVCSCDTKRFLSHNRLECHQIDYNRSIFYVWRVSIPRQKYQWKWKKNGKNLKLKTEEDYYQFMVCLQVKLHKTRIFTLDLNDDVLLLTNISNQQRNRLQQWGVIQKTKVRFDKLLTNLIRKSNKLHKTVCKCPTSINKTAYWNTRN